MTARTNMGGKPVHFIESRVLNMSSGFKAKLLCDGPTFTTGSACQYQCSFCYVPAIMRKSGHVPAGQDHFDVVVRRSRPIETIRSQLTTAKGKAKYLDPADRRVIYGSPLVDVAANMDLVRETVAVCREILSLTNWQIRLLSKSNLLPKVAQALTDGNHCLDARARVIFGVSTGTLDDKLAQAFEEGCPLVSKRIASLRWLQDNGFRTFGMVCPSLPQTNYLDFARDMAQAIRADRCEHIWAEVINVRGESFNRTWNALHKAGFDEEAKRLRAVSGDVVEWEQYARATFEAHAALLVNQGKLRFLQYVNNGNRQYWQANQHKGAVLL